MIYLVSFVLIFTSSSAFAQYPLPANGSCEGFCQPRLNFTTDYFDGTWFMVYNIPYFFLNTTKCIYIEYHRVNETELTFDFNEKFSDGTPKITGGRYSVPEDGTVRAVYTNINLIFSFNVVSLTQNQFAFLECRECGYYSKKGSGIYVFIFSRVPYPSCVDMQESFDALAACGIPKSALAKVDHSSCQTSC